MSLRNEGRDRMNLICPKCAMSIPTENVNIGTDLAKCENCQEILKASELVESVDIEDALTPPAGTAVTVSRRSDDVAFAIPAAGFSGAQAFGILFATFWICFVGFWTWGAAHGSILFAAFSIPFWAVGIGMWVGIITSVTQKQRIELVEEGLRVLKKSVLGSKRKVIPYDDIASVGVECVVPREPWSAARHMSGMQRRQNSGYSQPGIRLATIRHGTVRTTFAESVSDAEMEWLCSAVRALIESRTGRKLRTY